MATPILWVAAFAQQRELIWSDEFDTDGPLSEQFWNFEEGFVRNHELQWYQPQNAYCKDGVLVLEARGETFSNPNYEPESSEWRSQRKDVEITSASVNTRGKMEFQYGTIEVRAKIPTVSGAWPAIWTLGKDMKWPSLMGKLTLWNITRLMGCHIFSPTQPAALTNHLRLNGTARQYHSHISLRKTLIGVTNSTYGRWIGTRMH